MKNGNKIEKYESKINFYDFWIESLKMKFDLSFTWFGAHLIDRQKYKQETELFVLYINVFYRFSLF